MKDGRTGTAGGRRRAKKRNQLLKSRFCLKPFEIGEDQDTPGSVVLH